MKMSVCITLKDRARLLEDKIKELLAMDYDPKLLEVCVTDGGDSQEIRDMLWSYAPQFCQTKYARSDRDQLPFRIPFNNPACDINAQVCNVASFDKIIRTDAEVRFMRTDTLAYIARVFEKRQGKGVAFTCYRMKPEYKHENIKHRVEVKKHVARTSNDGFYCVCFDRRDFMKRGGVDERFALGFAAEDSHFCWWWRANDWMLRSHKDHRVMHLDHGESKSAGAVRLWKEYTMPLYQMMKHYKVKPNAGNPFWKRPEMITEMHVWRDTCR
jgi:hypothetical protein